MPALLGRFNGRDKVIRCDSRGYIMTRPLDWVHLGDVQFSLNDDNSHSLADQNPPEGTERFTIANLTSSGAEYIFWRGDGEDAVANEGTPMFHGVHEFFFDPNLFNFIREPSFAAVHEFLIGWYGYPEE